LSNNLLEKINPPRFFRPAAHPAPEPRSQPEAAPINYLRLVPVWGPVSPLPLSDCRTSTTPSCDRLRTLWWTPATTIGSSRPSPST